MSQSMKIIQELLGEMESLQSLQETEIGRLRRRQESIEERRKELFDQVAMDSADTQARNKLTDIEDQLENLQAEISQAESALRTTLFNIRQRIIELRNEELSNLEEQTRQIRERRKLIHNELLPDAQRHLDALQEEETGLQHQLDEVAQQVKALNAIDLQPTTMA